MALGGGASSRRVEPSNRFLTARGDKTLPVPDTAARMAGAKSSGAVSFSR